jgi:hypothetical protein
MPERVFKPACAFLLKTASISFSIFPEACTQVSYLQTCNSSEFAMLWQTELSQVVYVPAVRVNWSSQEADLLLEPEGPADESFLTAMQPSSGRTIIGYKYHVGICELLENKFSYEDKQTRLWLRAAVRRADFIPPTEVALGGTSADKLAEMRARRLLLNENPYVESRDINAITRELFIGGQGTVVRVQQSPFPQLYMQYGSSPAQFLGIAWIHAIVLLKLSACVADVTELQLTLLGNSLNVSFNGRRSKQYRDRPPYEIQIRGACLLS